MEPPSEINSIDVLKVQQSLYKKGCYSEDFHTLHIDLTRTEEEIFKDIARLQDVRLIGQLTKTA
ncbi:MAG: hypothetical protein LBS55_00205 [Prevotellaceae bacterium]|jgi:hypothetical protein|nr:hypothetical protein [Prevotellaceae bacterium]